VEASSRAARVAVALGARVRDRRQRTVDPKSGRPLSQERLAELAGLHRTYIGHLERGEVNVALYNIVRVAAALRIDPADLVSGLRP
jgi:predicted transcriptional regulator